MWKDDCWRFDVDANTVAPTRSFGKERNGSGDLVVTANPDLTERGLAELLEDLSKNPPTEQASEPDENIVVYNNADLTSDQMTENLRKIVDFLRLD